MQMTAKYTKLFGNQVPPLQTNFDVAMRWGDECKLTFKVSKCKVLHIGHTSSRQDCHLRGTPMHEVTEEKDLEVFVDSWTPS